MADTKDLYVLETNNFSDNLYQITDTQSIPVYSDVQTYPCSNCGRCFNVESLRKHQPICKKSTQKQPRKLFDAGKQRATDSDIPYAATKETTQFYKDGTKPRQEIQKKQMSNWRDGHKQLVDTIRQARQVTRAMETGAPLPKPIPSQVPSDYIQCEYCQRHFNKFSAERHIPFCETQFKRKQLQYTTNNVRTPAGSHGRQTNINKQQHQINSAPTSFQSRPTQKTTGEKDFRRPPLNPNTFKRSTPNESTRNIVNGAPSKFGKYRMTKIRSATGNYITGMMRKGQNIENNDLNVMAAVEREHSNHDGHQQRTKETQIQSPRVAHRKVNGDHHQQQQKIRAPLAPTAAKHCYECGEAFPVEWAKFCCACGEKRFGLE